MKMEDGIVVAYEELSKEEQIIPKDMKIGYDGCIKKRL